MRLSSTHGQMEAMTNADGMETTSPSTSGPMIGQSAVPQVNHPFCSASDGLGLYGLSFPHQQQASPMYPASPDTADRWTRQTEPLPTPAVSAEARSSTWVGGFEEFQHFTSSPMTLDHSITTLAPAALGIRTPSSALNYPQVHGMPLSVSLPSHRSSISSAYPGTANSYRSDDTEPTMYSPVKAEGSTWFENFSTELTFQSGDSEAFSPPVDSADHLPIMLAESCGVSPSQINTMAESPYSSAASSPTLVRSHVPLEDGRTVRGISMGSEPADEDGRWEQALDAVARTRKRRRYTSPSTGTFRCEICGKCMSRRHNLKKHLQTHEKARVKGFGCQWRGCTQAFTRLADLRRHEKSIHTKVKDEVCKACGQKFPRRDTLRRHVEDGCRRRRTQTTRSTKTRTNPDIRPRI